MATLSDGASPTLKAQAQLNGIMQQDASKNSVPVHTFNPDASPEAKGAAAGKGKDKLESVMPDAGAGGTGESRVKSQEWPFPDTLAEVAVDTGHSDILPTITVEDVDRLDAVQESSAVPQEVAAPGAMPPGPAPAIPDWYKVGWRAVGGIDEPTLTEGEVKDKAVLDTFLKEQFYGEWYHNAALIVLVSGNTDVRGTR